MRHNPDSFRLFWAIGAGGALGACTRYAISTSFSGFFFPYGTLVVNLAGCFLLTYIIKTYSRYRRLSGLFLTGTSVGFIGSLTTFSALALETIELLEQHVWIALLYIFLSLFGGLWFCWIGYEFASKKEVRK